MTQPATAAHDRTVFFVSDGTGITAETLGHSVLTQFEHLHYRPQRLPFIDSADKAREAAARINDAGAKDGKRPIVFSTLVDPVVSSALREGAEAFFIEMFETFVEPLERELGLHSTHTIGRSHAIRVNSEDYKNRIEAINFTLAHDDGQSAKGLSGADVILVGVSRSGKTPTSLYLAMQYGVFAANYPLAEEELEAGELPRALLLYRDKLYGLILTAERLQQIRGERRPGSRYASAQQVQYELRAAQALYDRFGVPYLDVTECSIEEIASRIMDEMALERHARS